MSDHIHYDSDRAAQYKTGLSGWVSSIGRFWGEDERMARWEGCTHKNCEGCGAEIERARIKCSECVEVARKEKYEVMPATDWDGSVPLYSDSFDEYFFDESDLADFCFDNDVSVKDLDLVICEPVEVRSLDEDYFTEDLHEDAELPDDLLDAIEAVNKAVAQMEPICWRPGSMAARVNL